MPQEPSLACPRPTPLSSPRCGQWHSLWSRRGGPPDFFVGQEVNGTFSRDGDGDHDGYVIAFVREPVSRLISAWKDKMACGLYLPTGLEGEGDGGYSESASLFKRKENMYAAA